MLDWPFLMCEYLSLLAKLSVGSEIWEQTLLSHIEDRNCLRRL